MFANNSRRWVSHGNGLTELLCADTQIITWRTRAIFHSSWHIGEEDGNRNNEWIPKPNRMISSFRWSEICSVSSFYIKAAAETNENKCIFVAYTRRFAGMMTSISAMLKFTVKYDMAFSLYDAFYNTHREWLSLRNQANELNEMAIGAENEIRLGIILRHTQKIRHLSKRNDKQSLRPKRLNFHSIEFRFVFHFIIQYF